MASANDYNALMVDRELPFYLNSEVRDPYPGEINYFRSNPKVAGMATEDNKVIINPFTNLSDEEKQSVIKNERARLAMRNTSAKPKFDLTEKQQAAFGGYSTDEDDRKQTIAARIYSGDPSALDATEEQRKWVSENLKNYDAIGQLRSNAPLPYQTQEESAPYMQSAEAGKMLMQNVVDEISGKAEINRKLARAKMLFEGGTITQGNALDFNPAAKSAIEGLAEATGVAPSERVMTRLNRLQSPVLRPDNAFDWGGEAAGLLADTAQTGLAAADMAAFAPLAYKGLKALGEAGQVDVWHGSPHKFDTVSHDKIGTGEGAQAFGWGTYYTDKKDIAAHYAKADPYLIQPPRRTFLGKELEQGTPEYHAATLMETTGKTLAGVKNEVRGWIKNAKQGENVEHYQSVLNALESATSKKDFGVLKPAENVYKAQLFPGKDPSEYTFLDWYEPLSSNPKALKQLEPMIKGIAEREGISLEKANEYYGKAYTGEQLYKMLVDRGFVMDSFGKGEKGASLFLKSQGIDGIRYPTETLSGKGPKGGDAFNYVVFDDKDVRLVSRESGGKIEDLLKGKE